MGNDSGKLQYRFYRVQNKLKVYYKAFCFKYLKKRYRPSKLSGIKVITSEEGNKKLFSLISSGKPFCAVRYGSVEMEGFCAGKEYELGIHKDISQHAVDTMMRQAGFFPNDASLLPRFTKVMEDCSKQVDFLATYGTQMENYMLKKYIPKGVTVSDNRALEPYYFQHNDPWTKALKGKRVLVIHPFSESIKKQYEQREKLFEDTDVLPEFELHTVKAVQTIVGTKDDRFENWFEALDYMYEEAMKIPFDIALIGCGAYGLPLAGMLKKAGKQAIHIGGAIQIMFGIKGRRWDLHCPQINVMYNDYWVRPSADETPKNKEKNEDNGAYW